MLEDISVAGIHDDQTTLEEILLQYTCLECKVVTLSKSDMDKHVKLKHSETEDEEVKFECTACKHLFTEVEDYNSHVKTHETTFKSPHQPGDIPADLVNRVHMMILEKQILELEQEKALNHEKKHEELNNEKDNSQALPTKTHEEIITIEDATFPCKVCPKIFEDENIYVEHTKTHSNVSTDVFKFYCTQCEKKFCKEEDLKEHWKKHHVEKVKETNKKKQRRSEHAEKTKS